jgi:hypothetical protein
VQAHQVGGIPRDQPTTQVATVLTGFLATASMRAEAEPAAGAERFEAREGTSRWLDSHMSEASLPSWATVAAGEQHQGSGSEARRWR